MQAVAQAHQQLRNLIHNVIVTMKKPRVHILVSDKGIGEVFHCYKQAMQRAQELEKETKNTWWVVSRILESK